MHFSLSGLLAGWKDWPGESPGLSRHLATGLDAQVARLQSPILRASKEILNFCSAKGKSKRCGHNQQASPKCQSRRKPDMRKTQDSVLAYSSVMQNIAPQPLGR